MSFIKSYGKNRKNRDLGKIYRPSRNIGSDDVLIEIIYASFTSQDVLNMEKDDCIYPYVPGIDAVGMIQEIGHNVHTFSTGMIVGVGRIIDTCRNCERCFNKDYYNCKKPINNNIGRLNQVMIVNQNYLIKIRNFMNNLYRVSPLISIGSEVYASMKRYGITNNNKIGIIGFNDNGHIATKIALKHECDVTVFSETDKLKNYALADLKVDEFILLNDKDSLRKINNTFDFLLDTRLSPTLISNFIPLLKDQGELSIINKEESEIRECLKEIKIFDKVIRKSNKLNLRQIEQFVNYCTSYNLYPDTEVISIYQIKDAIKNIKEESNQKIFVIDMLSIRSENQRVDVDKEVHSKVVKDFTKELEELNKDDNIPSIPEKINLEAYVETDEESEIESDSED
tara:strand:+ start:428 stop:1618 length:1191 start_codon:yes stop_codon:yes gene_type:complete